MSAYELTERAVARREIDALLLGEGEYARFPRDERTGLTTHPVVLLRDGIHPYAESHPNFPMAGHVEACLARWENYLLGIATYAVVLCAENKLALDGKFHLGLDLHGLALRLMAAIRHNRPNLQKVQDYGGRGYPDGMLGNLRRLSLCNERIGGHPFFPPEIRNALSPAIHNPPYAHLEPVVETLIASGNKRMHPERFVASQYHWTCFMRRRIDFELIRRAFVLPDCIHLDEGLGSIFDNKSFVEIMGGRD